ncbi:D-amino acid dehydrogenase [soil metagenome]
MQTTVVGAGVIGLSCAYELTELGHQVTVVDAGATGAGSSAGNAGWITPVLATPRAHPGVIADAAGSFFNKNGPARLHPHCEIGFASWITQFLRASTTRRNREATAALQQLSTQVMGAYDALGVRGVEFEQYSDGLAVVFKRPDNLDHFQQTLARMRSLGYVGSARLYLGDEVSQFDPAISEDVAGALHLGSERHVRPETLTRGLARALVHNGGKVIEHDGAVRVRQSGDGTWTVITRSGSELPSAHVVIAAGLASPALLRPLKVVLPMEAAKGTSLTAIGSGTVPRHPLKLYENMVACSPFGDAVRLSGTFDIGARGSEVNTTRLDMVLRQGLSYLRDWRPTRIDLEWAGHRPTTADDLPVIGPVPGHRGLYVATGHGTLGVTLGPVTGALAATEIALGTDHRVLAPFRINRFQ